MADESSLSQTDIRAAITAVWPEASVIDICPISNGKNAVCRVRLTAAPVEDIVLKAGTATPARVSYESTVMKYVASETGLPVPTVIETISGENSANPLEVPYYLMEAIEGRTYERGSDDLSTELFEQVCYEAGQNLGTLHTSFTFDGVGPLEPAGSGLAPPMDETDWPDLYREVIQSQLDALTDSRFDDLIPDLDAYADHAAEELAATGPFDPVFTHLDYRLENLKLRTDTPPHNHPVTVAILDWGGAAAAPAAYELAHTERILLDWPSADADRRAAVREQFYEGYTETGGRRPRESSSTQFQYYHVPARLRLMKHFETVMDDASQSLIQSRAREHRKAVHQLIGEQ